MDLDHFKAINDGSGHQAGDLALVSVAGSLSRHVRATDVVARVGGDEFALLFPRTSALEALAISQRILADVAHHREALQASLTASIGIAERDARSDIAAEDFLAAADEALYRAKAAGGGRASVSLLTPGAPQRPRLASAIRGDAPATTVRAGAPRA